MGHVLTYLNMMQHTELIKWNNLTRNGACINIHMMQHMEINGITSPENGVYVNICKYYATYRH
jgi:hypothetical protein